VRELENLVRKVLLLAQGYTISVEHARSALTRTAAPAQAADRSLRQLVDELLSLAQSGEAADAHAQLMQAAEKELFSRAIELARGNQARAARWVGVSRLTMREKLIQFGMHPRDHDKD
jgi:DNA-binding NtrC family response regulator